MREDIDREAFLRPKTVRLPDQTGIFVTIDFGSISLQRATSRKSGIPLIPMRWRSEKQSATLRDRGHTIRAR
jgi:hypothetical protein